MLLTIDLGNSYCKLGLFDKDQMLAFEKSKTRNTDYKSFILQFIYKAGVRENMVEDIIMSSVVPSEMEKIKEIIISLFNKEPILINNEEDYGVRIEVDNPKEVGSDIVVMAAYGYHLYKTDLIFCSLGTYSVIFYVSEDGAFKSCIIAPGYKRVINAMASASEQLPDIAKEKKTSFIATNTVDAMSVGFFNGFVGMIENLVLSLRNELRKDAYIVACGGISREIAPYTKIFDYVEPDFVTLGLNYIYNRYYRG